MHTWGKHGHFNVERARALFLAKVEVSQDGCWNWRGAVGSHGRYGSVGVAGRSWLAHRAAWFLFCGNDPGAAVVCHRCDNGLCVNPNHLFLGEQADNVLDMEAKGRSRHPRGESHGRAKLTLNDVARIRQLHAEGASLRSIARQYPQVARNTVKLAASGVTWSTT